MVKHLEKKILEFKSENEKLKKACEQQKVELDTMQSNSQGVVKSSRGSDSVMGVFNLVVVCLNASACDVTIRRSSQLNIGLQCRCLCICRWVAWPFCWDM
eukprot:SAG31_NODE_3871_length_3796_cov_3.386696_2_plen_100_part_00